MIPKLCHLGEHSVAAKPVSLYWAWNRADGVRKAYRQACCVDCFRENYAPLIVKAEDPVLICPACGIGTADDYDAVYLTYYVPGMPKGRSDLPLCGSCAVVVRNKAMTGATQLDDREEPRLGASAPRQETSADQVWAALGLRPRA